MDRRAAYLRRAKAGSRLKHRLAAATALGVAGGAALLVLFEAPQLPHGAAVAPAAVVASARGAASASASMDGEAAASAPRRIYPYSVVPGGVHGRAELLRVTSDRVVAQHYAAFDIDKAAVRTVDKPRAVYVSYRKGDKVYWTASRHMLAQGESVLSDGHSEIRARCGNRISDTAQLPVEVKGPTQDELDSSTEEGLVDVGYAFDQAPASGNGHVLTSFPNGAGLLVAGAGAPERPGNWSGGMPPIDDWRYGLAPATVTGTEAGGAADVAHGADGGTTVETQPVSTGGSGTTVETQPVSTGGSGGSMSDPGRVPDAPSTDAPPDVTTPPVGSGTPDPADPAAPVPIPPEVLWPPTQPVPAVPTVAEGDVPEPGSLWLSGIAFAALLVLRRRR